MNTQNTLTIADNKTLASNVKVDANNKIVCSIATISDAILNLEKTKDKADYGISVLVNTLSSIDNDVYKSLDVSYTDKDGKTVTVDNWTKYCKYRFDYSQSHCSKLRELQISFSPYPMRITFLHLKQMILNTSTQTTTASLQLLQILLASMFLKTLSVFRLIFHSYRNSSHTALKTSQTLLRNV